VRHIKSRKDHEAIMKKPIDWCQKHCLILSDLNFYLFSIGYHQKPVKMNDMCNQDMKSILREKYYSTNIL
jgi:hypothetical protein